MPRELIDIDRARALVLEHVRPLPAEDVPLREAAGRTLADDAVSTDPVPGFDNSAMDGFAVRAADTRGAGPDAPVALAVAAESRAGGPAETGLGPGQAIAISTGAMIPSGADAVIRVEDTRPAADGHVELLAEVSAGRNVRRAGEDVAGGQRVLAAGTVLGAAEIGVLASLGLPAARCARRPRVAILATGDELVEPGEPLRPGAVRNSNAYSVPLLAADAGAEIEAVETVADDADATRERIAAALAADVLVVCGGVSVGEHDHVRGALAELGAEEVFWGVRLKPGKPTYFGTLEGSGTAGLAFGLPGNPVSAMVTFLLFVDPALRALQGGPADPAGTTATLVEPIDKRPGRAQAVRCALELRDDGLHATPTGDQGSHVLTSMLGAEALAMVPAEAGPVAAGERVELILLPGALRRGARSRRG